MAQLHSEQLRALRPESSVFHAVRFLDNKRQG